MRRFLLAVVIFGGGVCTGWIVNPHRKLPPDYTDTETIEVIRYDADGHPDLSVPLRVTAMAVDTHPKVPVGEPFGRQKWTVRFCKGFNRTVFETEVLVK